MKTVIRISLRQYGRFLKRCDPACREYEILEIGPVLRLPQKGRFARIVEIHCELLEAQILLAAARRVYPAVVSAIEMAIFLAVTM